MREAGQETRHTWPKRETEMLPRLLSRTTITDDGSRTLMVGAGVEPVEGIEGGLDAVLGRERSSSAWARRAVSCSTRWKICDMWRVSIGTSGGVLRRMGWRV